MIFDRPEPAEATVETAVTCIGLHHHDRVAEHVYA